MLNCLTTCVFQMFFPSSSKKQSQKRRERRQVQSPTRMRHPAIKKIQIEMEDEAIDIFDQPNVGVARFFQRLGPNGKYFLVSIVIAMLITFLTISYDQRQVGAVIGDSHYNVAQINTGKTLYIANCAFCHGDNLEGQAGWDKIYEDGGRPPTSLMGIGKVSQLENRDLFDIIKYGGQPFSPPGYTNNMPGFEIQLDDKSIWLILAYLKSRWLNKAQP
jgi:mono/diheme cytochrome c family protein